MQEFKFLRKIYPSKGHARTDSGNIKAEMSKMKFSTRRILPVCYYLCCLSLSNSYCQVFSLDMDRDPHHLMIKNLKMKVKIYYQLLTRYV